MLVTVRSFGVLFVFVCSSNVLRIVHLEKKRVLASSWWMDWVLAKSSQGNELTSSALSLEVLCQCELCRQVKQCDCMRIYACAIQIINKWERIRTSCFWCFSVDVLSCDRRKSCDRSQVKVRSEQRCDWRCDRTNRRKRCDQSKVWRNHGNLWIWGAIDSPPVVGASR